ncbi:MAG: heavy-metal-associated domain-containing protein, partial [Candidatus Binatia bacterium]
MSSVVFAPSVPPLAQEASPPDSPQQIIVRVDGASCPFCAFGLEKRLGRIEGVADVKLEMKAGKVIVTLEESATVSEQALREAVDEAGFTPREITFP